MDLRSVPTDAMQRELKERSRCVDCKTEWSTAWHAANAARTRIRCDDCHSPFKREWRGGVISSKGFQAMPKAE